MEENMRRQLQFLLLALLLAAKTLNASSSLPPSVTVPQGAISVALLALTVSLDIVAIGYVLSKIFPQTGIGDWLKGEYWEIFKSAMLIVSIFAIITLITNVSHLLVPSVSTPCSNSAVSQYSANYILVNEACGYLSGVNTYLGTTLNYLLGLSATFGALDSLSIGAYLPIPLPYVGFSSGFVLKPYQNSLLEGSTGQLQAILSDAISLIAFPVAVIIELQISALPFLYVAGLVVLIPMGLVMRALPFIRGIGGSLIAIGLAIAVIYPSLLILMNYPITQMLQTNVYNPLPSCDVPILCNVISAVLSYFSGVVAAGVALASFNSIFPALNGILAYNTYLVLQFVLFILDLGITYSLANNIAHMLGGEIRLSIGGKLKLA
jgi:hypothetical protein